MKLLKIILYPFVPLYTLVIGIRNFLFDQNIFRSKKIDAKIISVGNITVGGSGKTPMVIYLTNLIKELGCKVGVLSRGYGRDTVGYLLVSNENEILTTVEECGDEIFQTVMDCNVPAAVSENRVNGAIKMIADTSVNFIVLDDAFQHRWIERDLDLLVIDENFLTRKSFFTHNLLPTGLMREGFNSINRADAVIINRKFFNRELNNATEFDFLKNKKVFTSYYKALSFVDMTRKTEYPLNEFSGQDSLVVSGIARPESFLNILKNTNVNTNNKMIFSDHKKYTFKEVQRIRKEFYSTNSHSVVTTEKDAVKLSRFAKELDDIDIFYLKIALALDDEESFKDYIISKLNIKQNFS